MRQYRLRTIMALIVLIAVSMWVGMLIERARQPTRGKTFTTTYAVSRSANTTTKGYAIVRPVYHVSGDKSQP
jgi:predicted permease